METPDGLVIFGLSNILSDLFDCALEQSLPILKVVIDMPESARERDLTLDQRLAALSGFCGMPTIEQLAGFSPSGGERYILGPTTPTREALADRLVARFGLDFTRLIHPTAYVSRLAQLGQGVFIGANSIVGPGARLGDHVFVNRGVTIGHDTQIGAFSRIQPGSHLGGLSRIGRRVTVGLGSTMVERLVIGDDVFVTAGSVVTRDVAAGTRFVNRRSASA